MEHLGSRLLRALAPEMPRQRPQDPPSLLGPWTETTFPTPGGGTLAATWFPVEAGTARGTVILAHPWVPGGQAYFFRRARLKALRQARLNALTFDFAGFGESTRRQTGFPDRDLETVIESMGSLQAQPPLHFWGVSAGAYWGHLVLSRRRDIASAMFEETPAHLIEWSDRTAPHRHRFHSFYRRALAPVYRYLDLRLHAASFDTPHVGYVSGLEDPGIPAEDTRELSRLANGRCRLVPGAAHLDVIKRDSEAVIQMALDLFEESSRSCRT